MDRLKKLFRRKKDSDSIKDAPTPTSSSKRPRTPGSFVDGAKAAPVDSASPTKKVRREPSNNVLQQEMSRADSHSDSIDLPSTAPVPPKLEWSPNPVGGNLSNMFDDLSAKSPPQEAPQARPRDTSQLHRKQSSQSNRHSLPPAALFARGLKRFNEEPSTEDTTSAVKPVEPPRSEVRDSMTLDDILNQPLFGDRPTTFHEGDQSQHTKYFSHLSDNKENATVKPAQTELLSSEKAFEPEPSPAPKPKRHPLIP